ASSTKPPNNKSTKPRSVIRQPARRSAAGVRRPEPQTRPRPASATALLRPPRITGRTLVAGLAVKGERSESRSDTEGALDGQHGDLIINAAGEDEAPWPQSLGGCCGAVVVQLIGGFVGVVSA